MSSLPCPGHGLRKPHTGNRCKPQAAGYSAKPHNEHRNILWDFGFLVFYLVRRRPRLRVQVFNLVQPLSPNPT